MSKLLQTLSEEECKKLLDVLAAPKHYVSSSPATVRNFTMALIMLDTGLRVGELVKLQIADLWFHDAPVGSLFVRAETAKNRRSRVIPLTERLGNAIFEMSREVWLDHLDTPHRPAFSQHKYHTPLSTRMVQYIICRAATASIGRCIHPHVLRHTFATRLMEKTNMRVVQQLLGHSSLSSTQVYTHPNNQDLKKAIEGLE